jgi:hypothetical protein
MPLLPSLLPFDQLIYLLYALFLVHLPQIDCALDKRIHIQLSPTRALAKKVQYILQPSHQRAEEPIVVDMYLVHKFVKVVLVPSTQVDEALHSLIRISGDILPSCFLDHSDPVIGEDGKIRDAAVNIGGFVHAHKRLVEDTEEVAE